MNDSGGRNLISSLRAPALVLARCFWERDSGQLGSRRRAEGDFKDGMPLGKGAESLGPLIS